MAKVRIHNMMFYGFHGVYEYEREQGQKFYVDIEIETKDDRMAETDDVKDGVDPAAHIGDKLLAKYPHFRTVTARIRKPSVPISGPIDYVEVETTRVQG